MLEEPREMEITRFPDGAVGFTLHYTRAVPDDSGVPIFRCLECGLTGNWTKFQGHIYKTHPLPTGKPSQ